jgi:hypothetical protein
MPWIILFIGDRTITHLPNLHASSNGLEMVNVK